MNWEQVEGKWQEFKGDIRERWEKLTDEDLGQLAMKKDAVVGKIQERYNIMKDDAERQVDEWMRKIEASRPHQQPPQKH